MTDCPGKTIPFLFLRQAVITVEQVSNAEESLSSSSFDAVALHV